MDPGYYPYPYEDQEFDRVQRAQIMLQQLQEKRQGFVMNLQSFPYQRNEIEARIRQVDREIQQCHEQLGPMMDSVPYGYPPKGSNHGSYMSPQDSAIASGATSGVTTKAPSVVAEGDLERSDDEDQFQPPQSAGGFGYQGYPEQQPRGSGNEQIVQGRPDRVRMTMFPEDGVGEVPSTQMMPNQPTNLQRLSQPAQILKAIISGLATYQGSSEMTSQVLPELAKLLSSHDESMVLETAKLIMELSKKEASCRAIVSSELLVSSLIKAMSTTGNADLQKSLSGTLHNVSNDRHGQLMIYNCGGIPYLVRLLTSQVNAVLFYAITTLHNMLLHYEPAKMDVRLAGGLEKMVALLVKDNPKFLAITADCLHLLAYGHTDSKLIILASGGPSLLVRIMRLYTYEKLLWTCSRLMKVLSVCPSNKPEIVQAGGMQALASHLGHKSTRLVQNIVLTIRNLSDAATKQDHLDDLLRQLLMLLGSNDVNIVTCSAGVLSNLTCNNPKNKTIVCKLQGVEAFLRTINNSGGREDIIESAVCALRHITSRHPNAEIAQNTVRLQNGIPMLTNFMQQQCRWPLQKALLGLVRNLALTPENLPVLYENHCVDNLWHILNRAMQESHRRANTGGSGYIDGVYMDEIVELSVGAMHLMAKDVSSRLKMKQLNCIPVFVQLLHSPVEMITRVAAGVLCELSQDPEVATLIEKQNATAPLTELLHSRHEAVAAYAAAILFCLSEDSRKQASAPSTQPANRNDASLGNVQLGYYNGGGGGGNMPHSVLGNMHSAAHPPDTGYASNDVSGLLTPDLDLPLDFTAFDDFPVTDSLHGFTSHPPSVPTPHTHHYTPQPQHMQHHPPMHPSHGHGHQQYPHQSYNPPSPAVMDTAPGGGPWFDSDL